MGFINPVLALCIPAAVLIVELVTYLSYHSFAFSFAIMYDNYDGELPIIETCDYINIFLLNCMFLRVNFLNYSTVYRNIGPVG